MSEMTETSEPITGSTNASPAGISSGSLVIIGLFIGALILGGYLVAWSLFSEKPAHLKKEGTSKLGVYGQIPQFELIDSHGQPFDSEQLLGKVWVADFIFTRCAGPCPMMTANMQKVQDQIRQNPQLASHMELVSITVDPDYDKPDVLRGYADTFGASEEGWHFLSGGYDQIQDLARNGFLLMVEHPADEPIIHSNKFVLIDSEGRIRGYYDGTEGTALIEMIEDARALVKEAQ